MADSISLTTNIAVLVDNIPCLLRMLQNRIRYSSERCATTTAGLCTPDPSGFNPSLFLHL